jgi:hypothetical protein
MLANEPTGSNGDTTAPHSQPESRSKRWPILNRLRGHRKTGGDAQVRAWKDAWVTGADARWRDTAFIRNPHPIGSSAAAAWSAGWRWAELQPDRRQQSHARLAHPYRRRTDTTSRLVRGAQAGAVGVSIVTLVAWMWQRRRQAAKPPVEK